MSEEKMDIFQFRSAMKDKGIDDEDIDEAIEKEKKKVHLLTFGLDARKEKVVSNYNNTITFVHNRFPGKVEAGDTWFCTVESNNSVYNAMPLYKVNASFLMNLNPELKEEVINTLWRRHKDAFEKDFAEKYKDEIHDTAIEEAKGEFEGKINELRGQVSFLENQLEQNRILNRTTAAVSVPVPDMIELGSDAVSPCIELGSDTPQTEPPEIPVGRTSAPRIPSFHRSAAPGIPEIRRPEKVETRQHPEFIVERIREDTIHSESFTDKKYFVHISPDLKMLVIRPNEFGSAFCINKSIRLEGLSRVAPFSEAKRLTAEYSDRYEGLIVYL